MSKAKEIEGSNLFGDTRRYTFNLMDAKTGTRLFHEYISLIVAALPLLGKFLSAGGEKKEGEDGGSIKQISDIVSVLPQILTWDRVEELAREMLAGHETTIDGTEYKAGRDGFHDGITGDPLEIYTAIFYAITVNYPKYIDPLLMALEDDEGDSSQDQGTETSPEKSITR